MSEPRHNDTVNCNIAEALSQRAAEGPDRIALVKGRAGKYEQWTFAELQASAGRFAAALANEGIEPGQRVMLMVRPSMEFIALTFALFRLGAVVILIDPGMGYANLLRCIAAVRPDALIGIPMAMLFSRVFPKPFVTVRSRICVGGGIAAGLLGKSLTGLSARVREDLPCRPAGADDPAAIIFTTGSTGPPKGVCYNHGNFNAQLKLIREYYKIGPEDVDQPCFPLFALFTTALGAKAVLPDMDAARPAKVDPPRFIRSIIDHQVTYSFGSPAIWNVVSAYCLKNNITLPVGKILMAGAPVSGELVGRVKRIMARDGEIHTPYGATESLPIASLSDREILGETWRETVKGRGTCVGRSLPGIEISIMEPREDAVEKWSDAVEAPIGQIGEIVVKGPVVTKAYYNNDAENKMAKIADNGSLRHRIGDMGYLDEQGRLWFCGRKAHRVFTRHGVLYTIPCEAIFNEHPAVFRSALVGVGSVPEQRPVIIVELAGKVARPELLLDELSSLARANELTKGIEIFLIHPAFPVDIRHNAKIFREKLAVWAEKELAGKV